MGVAHGAAGAPGAGSAAGAASWKPAYLTVSFWGWGPSNARRP